MKKHDVYDLIDINNKKGFPRVYRFNRFVRWFVILLALFAISYAVWYVFNLVDAASTTFQKIIPFIIIFFAGNSLVKNLFSLNSILFNRDRLTFRYIVGRNTSIECDKMEKLSIAKGKTRSLVIDYRDREMKKSLSIPMGYPNLLEIIIAITEMNSSLELDEFIKNVIPTDKERRQAKNRPNPQE